MRPLHLILIPASGVFLITAGIGAVSQAKDAQKPASKPEQKNAAKKEDKKPVPWNIQFESWEHNESTGDSDFTKVVAVSDEGTTMHSDSWKLHEKTKTAKATGNLKMTDPQADATAMTADVFYAKGKRLLVMTDNVEILVKPKKDKNAANPAPKQPEPANVVLNNGKAVVQDPNAEEEDSSGSARKHPATITCDKLEYEYAKTVKHATLTGNLKVVQKLKDKTRTLTAEKAEWFGLEDRLLLYPPVHAEDTKNLQSFDSNEPVTIFVTEGDERLIGGKAIGVYKVGDDEEDGPPAKPAKPDNTALPPKSDKQVAPPPKKNPT